MLAEPFIAFFLLRNVRKILNNTSPDHTWDQTINILLYAIVIFFIADVILHIEVVSKWIWHGLLLGMIVFALLKKEFNATRTLMYAVLPFALISLVTDLFKSITFDKYKSINDYFDIASIFAIVWMIAMVVSSRKQQRVLRMEHEKTKQQEEQKKFIAAQKDELEKIVSERTAELRQQKEQVENTLSELKSTQAQLIQSEKMASLGELTAGIAHEIQNPLNFVNNFSEVNNELIEEMKNELTNGNMQEAIIIANDIKANQEKINFHGKRADAIVKGMLQHSRKSTGQKEPTDINALADEYLRLAYHGLRAKDKTFNAVMKTDFDKKLSADESGKRKINIISQDIGRVILNLITNAFYAVTEKKKLLNGNYEPTVTVSTKKISDTIEIKVKDNGNGIPQKVLDKIFQPFFTTKPTGQGTGLGLSLSYDIIKAHGGDLKVETKEGEGSEFIIQLPVV